MVPALCKFPSERQEPKYTHPLGLSHIFVLISTTSVSSATSFVSTSFSSLRTTTSSPEEWLLINLSTCSNISSAESLLCAQLCLGYLKGVLRILPSSHHEQKEDVSEKLCSFLQLLFICLIAFLVYCSFPDFFLAILMTFSLQFCF